MKQSGRASAASLATVTVLDRANAPAPADLSPAEAAMWDRVLLTQEKGWWDAGSYPLLAQYCRLQTQAAAVGKAINEVLPKMAKDFDLMPRYEKLRKIQADLTSELNTLSRAMRLTQQSRYRGEKVKKPQTESKPWD